MAHLTSTDREILKQSTRLPEGQASPPGHGTVAPTREARARYCRWATEAAKFYKGQKPVRFTGDRWKL